MKFRYTSLLLVLATGLLAPAGCHVVDHEKPQMNFVYPRDGDTLDPGVYVLKVWAVDNQKMWGVEFWERREMLGIAFRSVADTWRMGWDCRSDTNRWYVLAANADDDDDNWTSQHSLVHVRR